MSLTSPANQVAPARALPLGLRLRALGRRLRSGLLGRFVAVLSAVGLIPLIIVPWLVQRTRDAVIEQILSTHAVAARTTAGRVDAWIRTLRISAQTLAENPMLVREGRAGAGEMIASLLQAEPAIVAVQLTNARGEPVTSAVSPHAFQEVLGVLARPADGATQLIETGGIHWLRLSLPLAEGRGELRMIADLSTMSDILKTEELGKDGIVGLFSADRSLLAASNVSGDEARFPESLLEAGSLRLTSGAKRYDDQEPILAGAHSVVREAPWFVATIQPATVAERTANDMKRTAGLAVLGALLLTALFSGLGYWTVVRPITELAETQWRAAKRSPALGSGNEITQLREALATLRRQTMDREAIGKIFLSRYLVLDLLGTGGMGSVFRGWDPKLERPVAIKTIHMGGAQASVNMREQRDILMREAVTVAKFNHPNIVAIYDLEDAGEAAFLAMEFVDGTSLERLLNTTQVLRVEQAVPLVAQVARGLEAAHQAGVIHCDIKPANVLLGRDGSVKVADFGIARSQLQNAKNSSGTFGTPGYLPPEALRQTEFSPAADLYSLAAVLYELVTGAPPHLGKNAQETLVKTAASPVTPLRDRNPSIPPSLDALVLGLLEKDPERRRPATAREMAEALEALAEKNSWKWTPPPVMLESAGRGAGARTGAEFSAQPTREHQNPRGV